MAFDLNELCRISNINEYHPVKGGILASGKEIHLQLQQEPEHYLYSGWQSWSLTAWGDVSHPVKPLLPAILRPKEIDPVHADIKYPHGSWYGAVDALGGKILFLGALGLDSHVTLEGNTLFGTFAPGSGDWYIAIGDEEAVMKDYADLLIESGRFFQGTGKSRRHPRQKIWCSWYSLYTHISEKNLLKILSDLEDLPFNTYQVDDGWQIGIGDWEPNAKFPSGMKALAEKINSTGRKAGLWLAPLLVVPSSGLFHAHPDWLLRTSEGHLVPAGFNWGEPLYTLDATHSEVREWLDQLMRKVRRWGYDYVKLDFLYAGALPGKRHLDLPREQAYRHALGTMRQALDDAYLLTCGAPILPSLGLCDAIRIGPDVSGIFYSRLMEVMLRFYSFPEVRNALRTSFHRLWLKQLIDIDPDVVYISTRDNNLTEAQKGLIIDLATICDYKALSEVPVKCSPQETEAIRQFLLSLPKITKTNRTSFEIDGRSIDFIESISLPPPPGKLESLLGELLGNIVNHPAIMRFIMKTMKSLQVFRQ